MTNETDTSNSGQGAPETGPDKAATRDQLRSEVVGAFPDMSPADVDAAVGLIADDLGLDAAATASLADEARSDQAAAEDTAAAVIPAAVLMVVARCAVGSMTSVAQGELYSLIVRGQTATASSSIQSAILGCLGGRWLPNAVKWVVKKFGPKVVAAALVVAIKLKRIRLPLRR